RVPAGRSQSMRDIQPPEAPAPADVPEVPDLPDVPVVDGPFVEVTPGTWVRASAILAVEPYPDDHRGAGAERGPPSGHSDRFAGVLIGGGSSDPVWWRSPYPPASCARRCAWPSTGRSCGAWRPSPAWWGPPTGGRPVAAERLADRPAGHT